VCQVIRNKHFLAHSHIILKISPNQLPLESQRGVNVCSDMGEISTFSIIFWGIVHQVWILCQYFPTDEWSFDSPAVLSAAERPHLDPYSGLCLWSRPLNCRHPSNPDPWIADTPLIRTHYWNLVINYTLPLCCTHLLKDFTVQRDITYPHTSVPDGIVNKVRNWTSEGAIAQCTIGIYYADFLFQ
jgi:hypothetical protein